MSTRPIVDLGDDDDWYMDHVVLAGVERESLNETAWRIHANHLRSAGPVSALCLRQGFVATRDQCRGLGVSEAEIRSHLRRGLWWLPGRGVIAPSPRPTEPALAAALRISAAAIARPGHIVSERSAARLHDLPLLGTPERTMDLVGPTSQRTVDRCIRSVRIGADDLTDWFGIPITSVERTVCDLARRDRAQGLVAADAALHRAKAGAPSLRHAVERLGRVSGAATAREVLVLADGLSESPLETLVRLLIVDAGLPVPELQAEVEITTASGRRQVRVDMLWRAERLVLEADGRLKYTADQLWKEKVRQEGLERQGMKVIRVLWIDVRDHPQDTVDRIAVALRRS